MEKLLFNNNNNFSVRSADSILSVFNSSRKTISLINQDMSVEEISDIISDKLISVVQSQFDATAKRIASETSLEEA